MTPLQKQYSVMFENMAQGAFFQRENGSLVDVNPAALEMLGLTRDQFLERTAGDRAWDVINVDGAALPPDQFPSTAAFRTGQPVRDFVAGVFNPQQKKYVWTTINAIPIFLQEDNQLDQVFVTLHNISEQKRLNDIHSSRLHLMQFARSHSLEEILVETLDEVEKLTASIIGFYHFYDEDLQTITLKEWSTRTSQQFCHVEGNETHYRLDKAGVWVDCVRSREPVVHNDYASLTHRQGLPEGHAPVVRELVVPVIRQGRIVAILGVGNKPHEYDETDIETVLLFADLAWDIAEGKQKEEKIRTSEKHYQSFVNTITEGVAFNEIIFNEVGEMVDYRILDVNPAYFSMADYHCDEGDVRGKLATEIYGMTSESISAFWNEHKDKKSVAYSEFTSPLNNRTFYVATSPIVDNKFVTSFFDITERKQIEESLRKSEQKFRSLFENIPDAVFLTIPDGTIAAANPAACHMFGWSEEEICKMGRSGLLDLEDPRLAEGLEERQRTGRVRAREVTAIRKNGERFPIGVDSVILDEKSQRSIVIIRDITERIQAEKALKEKEEKYRLLFQNQPSGFALHEILLDAEGKPFDYKFLEVNPAFEKLTGLKASGLVGKTVLDVLPNTELYWIETYGQVALSGNPITIENFSVELNRYYQVNAYSPEPGKFATIFYDITDRKQAELELNKLRDLYAAAEKAGRVGGWEFDISASELKWTEEVYQIHEVDSKTFQPTLETAISFYTPSSRPVIEHAVQRAIDSGDPYDLELEIRTAKGDIKSVHTIGTRNKEQQKIVGFIQDITERKRAEKELLDTRAMLQAAMDCSSAGIAIADAPDGKLRYVNDAGLLIRGSDRETVVKGIGIDQYVASWQLLDLDGRPLNADEVPLARAIMFGETCSREFIIRRSEGDDHIVSATAAPIKDEAGQVPAAIVVFTDITEQKNAAEERLKLEQHLYQAQKIESIGQLAGGVAHDFNNMLGVILGHAELALMKVEPSQPFVSDLEDIRTAAKRSADLTRQLLTFARKQTIAPKPLDLNETVAGMLKMLQRLIGENIELSWTPAANLWPVRMDPSQIDQILANLCVNARDAISGVGNIMIKSENRTIHESDSQTNLEIVPGDYVKLSVTDDGCGMHTETLSQIFEPFFTTKKIGDGTGLGLATVYGAVKQNNGYIEAISQPGQGARFDIYLPRIQSLEKTVPEAKKKPVPQGVETVLLVEDDKLLLRMTATMLEQSGYTVLSAATPAKAQKLAKEHQGPIHLLISDVVMPEMNGRELSEKLQTLGHKMKVMFMSGYPADIISNQGRIDEGLHFLQKPVSFETLTVKVREILDAD